MKIQAVKQACANYGWERIYANYSGLNDALQRGFRSQPCPKTGEGKTKFRFFKNFDQDGGAYHNDFGAMPDGIELLTWYTDQSKADVLKMLEEIVGGVKVNYKQPTRSAAPVERPYCTPEQAKDRVERIKKLYNESVPIVGTLAEKYLRTRGIKSFSDDYLCEIGNNLRFHPSLPYKEDDGSPWQRFPALLAIVRDSNGKPLTLHRTFLSPDGMGKAPISRPKMVLAPPRDMRGGFIMLDKPSQLPEGGHFIGLAEGIENALSAREGSGAPMWVGISDRLLAMINLPSSVRACVLYSDIEPSGAGQKAVEEFKRKNAAVDVINNVPKSNDSKVDWNDVYRKHGEKAFFTKVKEPMRISSICFDAWWEHHYAEFG